MKAKKFTPAMRGLAALMTCLMVLSIVGTGVANTYRGALDDTLGTESYVTINDDSAARFKTDYATIEDMAAAARDIAIREGEEGTVVMKNDNGVLPLKANANVALFGLAAYNVYGPKGGNADAASLADALAALYHTRPIRMDDFFLPPAMRTEERLMQPGGNVHYERFRDEVLAGLMRGGDVSYRRYDCQSGAWLERVHRAAPVAVIEGSYSHHPAFAEAYAALDALRIFVYTAEEERIKRLREREGERFFTFQTRWMPLEKSYIEAYDIKSGADIALESQPWA